MIRILATALLAVLMIAASSVWAEDKIADVTDMDALRKAVRADKKAYVESVLKLTPAEAKKFLPIYDAYQRGLDAANRRRTVAVEVVEAQMAAGRQISNLQARSLATEFLAADDQELSARRSLQRSLLSRVPSRAGRIIPAAKVDRYLQLESKIRAYQAYDIAATFPLVK